MSRLALGLGFNLFDVRDTSLPGDLSFISNATDPLTSFDTFFVGTLATPGPRVTIGGDLTYDLNTTTASIVTIGADVAGNVAFDGDLIPGGSFIVENMSVGGDLDFLLEAELTAISVRDVDTVGGDVNIVGDFLDFRINGPDALAGLTMDVAGDFRIDAGAIDDVFDIENVDVSGDLRISGGDGANSVTLTRSRRRRRPTIDRRRWRRRIRIGRRFDG